MPKKLHQCVKQVSRKKGVKNAWAICTAALKRKGKSG